MAAPISTPLPPAPSRSEGEAVFVPKANAFLGALEPFRVDLQAQADFINGIFTIQPEIAGVDAISAEVVAVAGNAANINAVAGNQANIDAVNANKANIDKVAAIDTDVSAVADIDSDVSALVANEANVNTVAANVADVVSVAAIDTDVSTVASISADVITVAGISAEVVAAEANATAATQAAQSALGDQQASAASALSAANSATAALQSKNQAALITGLDTVDAAVASALANEPSRQDAHRRAVEDATGGRNTVRFTTKGQPCYFYVQPKYNLEDLPGWDPADGTGVHPAFIQNGVEKGSILVGIYQAAEIAGEAVSQGFRTPRVSINYDNALALCRASGAGFDMASNWDWSAVAMWCMANGFQPRGNSSYGCSHEKLWETGSLIDPSLPLAEPDAPGKSTLTGSGPNGWRHDNSPHGIADLVGNVWEWQAGFKLVDGVAHIAPDGGVYTEEQYIDTEFSPALANPWSNTSSDGAPSILKQALIVPSSAQSPVGRGYINAEGERLPTRGGNRSNGAAVGPGALYLDNARANARSSLGFRLVFRE